MKIEISCDHAEGEEFVSFLNNHGHEAIVGNTTHTFVDGYDMFNVQDTEDALELGTALSALWAEYCQS